jgi:hypothetical protein
LCSLLQQACAAGSAEAALSWELFTLLQQRSASGSNKVQQQLFETCSVLLVQLSGAGMPAADKAVQVWQYCCAVPAAVDTALQQLSPPAQAAVVSALVAAQQDDQALSLVKHAPQLLPHLAQQWQQQANLQADTQLLLQALQLCVATASQPAVAAADTILRLPVLQQEGTWPDLKGTQLAAQVAQLLCLHNKLEAALQLLPACVSATGPDLTADTAATVSAIVASVTATITQKGTAEQQQQLLQLLVGSGQQQLLQAATSQCLAQAAPAAVGLLLHALQQSSPGQGLAALMQPQQLEQLCEFVCVPAAAVLVAQAVAAAAAAAAKQQLPCLQLSSWHRTVLL